jgi:methylglyoxal synthase
LPALEQVFVIERNPKKIKMKQQLNRTPKTVAIVVDDEKRNKLIEWSYFNKALLRQHNIVANDEIALILTGTLTVPVTSLPHGTFGGYRQLATMIENKEIDLLICMGSTDKGNNFQTGITDLISLATEHDIMVSSNATTAKVILESLNMQVSEPAYVPGPQSFHQNYSNPN